MNVLLWVFLWLSTASYGAIFTGIDTAGKRYFTDQPQQSAQRLQVNTTAGYYDVKRVYDGDTILLAGGKKVRLLGINTPEVANRDKAAEAGGDEAKQWLIAKLKGQQLRLVTDRNKKDKYGRWLAHVFTKAQVHVNLELVENGMATVTIYPPNVDYADALLLAQNRAQLAKRGIWGDAAYTPKLASQINAQNYRGWQRVIGRVTTLYHANKYSYLNIGDQFSLVIPKKSLALFPPLATYVGKQVEARGWISRRKQRYSLFVKHPSAIVVMEQL